MTPTAPHLASRNAHGRSAPICVVTGASSGIGFATAVALSRRGARLGLVCRDAARGEAARTRIRALSPKWAPIDLWIADLACLESTRAAARSIRAAYGRIDVLVNNAGAVHSKKTLSRDGIEMHFATHYVGHYVLTAHLIERLVESPAPRVVTLTSSLQRFGRLHLEDLAFDRPYHLVLAYARSKLAGALFTLELARRTRALGLLASCVDPGFVRTGIFRGAGGHQRWLIRRAERFGRDPFETGEQIAQLSGDSVDYSRSDQYWTPNGLRRFARRARDRDAAAALWRRSRLWLAPEERNRLDRVCPNPG